MDAPAGYGHSSYCCKLSDSLGAKFGPSCKVGSAQAPRCSREPSNCTANGSAPERANTPHTGPANGSGTGSMQSLTYFCSPTQENRQVGEKRKTEKEKSEEKKRNEFDRKVECKHDDIDALGVLSLWLRGSDDSVASSHHVTLSSKKEPALGYFYGGAEANRAHTARLPGWLPHAEAMRNPALG